jgi:hypothetical protein
MRLARWCSLLRPGSFQVGMVGFLCGMRCCAEMPLGLLGGRQRRPVLRLGRRSRRKPSPDFGLVPLMTSFADVAPLLGGIVEEPPFLSNDNVLISPGENPTSGGRWWCLRCFPLEGVVLESRHVAVWWCSSSVLACERQDGGPEWWWCTEAAASGPWRVATSWGAAASWLGLGGNLVSLMQRGCRLGRHVAAEAVDFTLGHRLRTLMWR